MAPALLDDMVKLPMSQSPLQAPYDARLESRDNSTHGTILIALPTEGMKAGLTAAVAPAAVHPKPAKPVVMVTNRGEIARRVFRTCHRLGVDTLAVYTTPDALAPHVREATTSVCLGENARAYTNQQVLLQIAVENGVTAIHPGYGFLSENEEFCNAVTEAGIAWLGPRSDTMENFALKHVARSLAEAAGVPVLKGSDLVQTVDDALAAARSVGYPVLLKATGGGGGMGIYICRNDDDVRRQLEASKSQGKAFFGNDGVFVEKYVEEAHHVEVQIFGDGEGGCVALGERECSIQRRHQKILEETPSPLVGEDEELRSRLLAAAVSLGASARYRSAGTVEFLMDEFTRDFFFLEVNTRLQVEHGITEMVNGNLDIVEAQLRLQVPQLALAGGYQELMKQLESCKRTGHSIEVRINGEDPCNHFQPCPGQLGNVELPPCPDPATQRVDTWVETGCVISPHYDSLLAKAMVWAPTRAEAAAKMSTLLAGIHLQGPPNNVEFLRALVKDSRFLAGHTSTRFLERFSFSPLAIEVVAPGLQTSIQDWPGRVGLWSAGVPPSGPMDSLAHRMANALVGNAEDCATLEFSLQGPTLRFHAPTLIALTGASFHAHLDGKSIGCWQSIVVKAGQVLVVGSVDATTGVRGYLAVKGGVNVPKYLGSRSTFPSGKFGGYQGRYLRCGDSLPIGEAPTDNTATTPIALPSSLLPPGPASRAEDGAATWEIGALPGPHADPDYITTDFMMKTFYGTPYSVHYNSNRLGVRLVGPKPTWVRPDGGDGGTHPSNVHDHVYALGAVNFTGDHPVVLTVDGPSLGGFVCPTTIISTEMWKVGQVRPGDGMIFKCLSLADAHAALLAADARIDAIRDAARANLVSAPDLQAKVEKAVAGAEAKAAAQAAHMPETRPLLVRQEPKGSHPGAEYRLAGDRYIQVEYGPQELDLSLRVRVHCLAQALERAQIPGFLEASPGVRSLMVEYDMRVLSPAALLKALASLDAALPDPHTLTLPSRIVRLPMTFNDSTTQGAIIKYMKSIRPEAPYLPSNIEYIAKNNGIEGGSKEVESIIFSASYMVLGLGDVYLGAPCAVPLDPRHRLVTTKYNPARTFTEEGTVGIGGSYMCIYPMDSPGGYQLVGRTLPIWNTFARAGPFTADKPWLLRQFDQVQYFPVTEEQLLTYRDQFVQGRYELDITETQFSMASYDKFCKGLEPEVAAIKARQRAAMDVQLVAETESLARLQDLAAASGTSGLQRSDSDDDDSKWDGPAYIRITAPFTASVWSVNVKVDDVVNKDDVVVILEAMKMETPIQSPCKGRVKAVRAVQSQLAPAGALLVVVEPDA